MSKARAVVNLLAAAAIARILWYAPSVMIGIYKNSATSLLQHDDDDKPCCSAM